MIAFAKCRLITTGNRTFTVWVTASSNGIINSTYGSMSIAGTMMGTKFTATLNGVVSTSGAGVGYFPGNVAGSLSSGGQYG
jgi:K+-transporting ATPase A subunit